MLRAVGDELEAWGEEEEPQTSGDQAICSTSTPVVATAAHLDQSLPSARQLAWLFVKDPSRLDEQEQQVVAFLQQEPMMQKVYQLSQQFLSLLKKQQGAQVEGWIGTCSSFGISELEAFAFGLQREVPAIVAACSMPYSNGPTEGIINRLKYIKRSMYGRGSFDLLRQRVLQSSSSAAA
jgi:transposase